MKIKFPRFRVLTAGSLAATALLVAFTPFNMGGCSTADLNYTGLAQGVFQGAQALGLSEKDEPFLGQTVVAQVTTKYRLVADSNLNRYVTLVGRTVAAASTRRDLKFYFGVVDTDLANAYSGPHGYVLITRGALRQMKDESELAGVLGHEIGHVCKHHGLNAVKNATLMNSGLKVAASSSKDFAQFSQGADMLGNIALNTGFSEPQEMEADGEGVNFATAAGYDPNGYLRFMKRLQAAKATGEKLFDTHPGIGDRIDAISKRIAKSGVTSGATLADRFAANVKLR